MDQGNSEGTCTTVLTKFFYVLLQTRSFASSLITVEMVNTLESISISISQC